MQPRTIDPQVIPLPLPERATFEVSAEIDDDGRVSPAIALMIWLGLSLGLWAAIIAGAWWLWTLIVR